MQKSVKRKQNIIFSFTNLDVWHVPNDSFSQSNSEMTFVSPTSFTPHTGRNYSGQI